MFLELVIVFELIVNARPLPLLWQLRRLLVLLLLALQQVRQGLLHDGAVELPLSAGEGTVDQNLLLWRNLEINVRLHSPEQERGQNLMES